MQWSDQANSGMRAAKDAFGASDAQMEQLFSDIKTWVRNNPNGSQRFQFGKLNNTGVTIHVTNSEVTNVEYGDN